MTSEERTKRIQEYFKHKEEMLKDVSHNWKENLGELEGIVDDFNDSVRAEIIESISWRVWGEVKRHRTLNQTAESIYNAVDRAAEWIEREELFYLPELHLEESQVKLNSSLLKRVMSVPESVISDENNFLIWSDSFYNSISAYNKLVKSGVKKSDAIARAALRPVDVGVLLLRMPRRHVEVVFAPRLAVEVRELDCQPVERRHVQAHELARPFLDGIA